MKVREFDKRVYNYISDCKIVTPSDLIRQFGGGDDYITSMFIPSGITLAGASHELTLAIGGLVESASIFEIACGERFYRLVGGDPVMSGGTHTVLPVIEYTYENNQVEYLDQMWLPVVYCNDIGLKYIFKIFYHNIENTNPSHYNRVLTYLNCMSRSHRNDRTALMCAVSELLCDKYVQWNQAIEWFDPIFRLMKKFGIPTATHGGD